MPSTAPTVSTDPALLSAEDMLACFGRRELSPVDVFHAVTERITRLNPELNAFAVMNPHAYKRRAKAPAGGGRGGRSDCWTGFRAR
jgi:aspartyl-tRNA(Asn)/glutamyl-tRNA(Gln) amidotransferase subunit A